MRWWWLVMVAAACAKKTAAPVAAPEAQEVEAPSTDDGPVMTPDAPETPVMTGGDAPETPVMTGGDVPEQPVMKATATDDGLMSIPVSSGRTCQDLPEGIPTTVEAIVEALEAGGVEVVRHEAMATCSACGCPNAAVMVVVDPESADEVAELSKDWIPEPPKTELKGSLP